MHLAQISSFLLLFQVVLYQNVIALPQLLSSPIDTESLILSVAACCARVIAVVSQLPISLQAYEDRSVESVVATGYGCR